MGKTDKSFMASHVARIAGLPHSVISRADATLKELEKSKNHLRKLPISQTCFPIKLPAGCW